MQRVLHGVQVAMLVGVLAFCPVAAQEDNAEKDFEGKVEVLYRNVNVDGSVRKYEEDFDGLTSGARVSNLWATWNNINTKMVDFLRLEARGLGGDPYESIAYRMGRKDSYDFTIKSWRQDYLYNLFELVPDLDASTWDSSRRLTDIDLAFHVTRRIDLFVEYQEVRRDGSSLFMKDINTNLFQLNTPLDQSVKRYSLGGKFRLGPVDLFFRQTLRRYDYQFRNTTQGDAGLLDASLATLDEYDWRQQDDGDTDLTTLTVSAPLGSRVNLTASVFGTLLGKEEITSNVALDASGTSYRGTCSVTGAVCDASNPCDVAVPGNVCVADPYEVTEGISEATIEADYLVVDADLSVNIVDFLDFHFQYRSLDREITSHHIRDLDGDGIPDNTQGTGAGYPPGVNTTLDYRLDSVSGIFDFAPSSKVRFRLGYRTIDRKLEREGYQPAGSERNADFESSPDQTLLLGLDLKPLTWFQFDADYEVGDITQPFTAVSPMEVDRLKARARFLPLPQMRLDLTYLSRKNTNNGVDFRRGGDCPFGGDVEDGCWNTNIESESYAVSFWHKAGSRVDYWLRWAEQGLDSVVAVSFDTGSFGIAESGNSVYENTSNLWSGQVNFSWARAWRGFVRFRYNDSAGNNDIVGTTYMNNLVINQDYSDVEAGVTYAFKSGLYIGGRYRVFSYDDFNNRLDYDGNVLTLVAGLGF
jgi:hypothetical protein